MNREKVDLLKQILKIPTQEQLHKVLVKFLRKHYKNVIVQRDFIIAEGNIPIALVAHMDTVHRFSPIELYYDVENDVMWSPQGLGADDRAGVYAIVDIIKRGFRPHVIFTTDEETGGIGAKRLVAMHPEYPFDQLKFIIELDRANKEDCVFYECANDEFTEYIESFGFEEDLGTFTDISIIAPAWRVAAVNLSVGYYNEHTLGEYLKLNELNKTIDRVINILQDTNSCSYEYVTAIYNNILDCSCILCNKPVPAGEGYVIYHLNGTFTFCPKCHSGIEF